MSFIPRTENKGLGPFITKDGEVECTVCVTVCEKQGSFTRFFKRDTFNEDRWQMLFKCPKCRKEYVIVAYEATKVVQ